jgi:cytochrome c
MNRRSWRAPIAALVLHCCLLAPAVLCAEDLNDARAKALFNAKGCNACHATDEARIGPPFRTVALRYANTPGFDVEWLAKKIRNGGAGSWGVVPMVSAPQVSPEQARAIVRWIMSLAPSPPRPDGES